ncbi:MAG: response regulator transcription factor [Elusimicrobiota bacterium]
MAEQKTILIVEDNTEFQALLQQIVEDAGYRSLLAVDGAAGLAAAKAEKPDLMLLDIQMPRMSGYEVTQAVRADAAIGRTPIILVSVESKMEDIVKGLKLGADDYVTKPFNPEEVLARVRTLFRQAGQGAAAS